VLAHPHLTAWSAPGKFSWRARQKSTHTGPDGFSFNAALAIDGREFTNASAGSCSQTSRTRQPWIALDLGKTIPVSKVGLVNRDDALAGKGGWVQGLVFRL
jgi:hypothetical protein